MTLSNQEVLARCLYFNRIPAAAQCRLDGGWCIVFELLVLSRSLSKLHRTRASLVWHRSDLLSQRMR